MFDRLAGFVARRWLLIIGSWFVVFVVLRLVAPQWESITHDGDFAYLPARMPSVVGERWLTEAFPHQRSRSQMVVAVIRDDKPLSKADMAVAYDAARRMKNLQGAVRLAQARRLTRQQTILRDQGQQQQSRLLHQPLESILNAATDALEEAVELDQLLADYWDKRVAVRPQDVACRPSQLAEIYHNLALLDTLRGKTSEAREHRRIAGQLDAKLIHQRAHVLPPDAPDLPLLDTWTWRESFFGDKLISRDRHARLIVLQLTNEFMAVNNIQVMRQIEAQLDQVRKAITATCRPGLTLALTGSAAVGADLLRSSAASIKHTELFTIVLVVLILTLVYRAPLLVAVPLVTIGIALSVSTGLVALLTQLSSVPGFHWWSLKVFTTTKIFIVVILFGAGTDYCLFLIMRYQEELRHGLSHAQATAASLRHVGDALAASALTTILGLGMMFFADFGKFHYSGPVIGLCLAVTLLTCVTLTPAMMLALGRFLFWPFAGSAMNADSNLAEDRQRRIDGGRSRWSQWVWQRVAQAIVARPGAILLVSVATMAPLAAHGVFRGNDVTYDFLSGLPDACPSKQGAALLKRHFPVGESGPVTVLVQRDGANLDSPEGRQEIRALSDAIWLPGVRTVRSIADPLGEFEPDEKSGTGSPSGRPLRVILIRAHPRIKAIFVAQTPRLAGILARLEVILDDDPFSIQAVHAVDRIQRTLTRITHDQQSPWYRARFALTGTTAAIRDLRTVTRRDNILIQRLVVLAVLGVLVIILRRPAVCIFMMFSVLLSYYVTLGITQWFFAWYFGSAYQGLDWKVPLFLFVILVAIGQDYNVYLATRVFEEQSRLGPMAGLRRAVIQTGGIITSCGVIMAGTFFSMTASAWGHLLPGFQWLKGPTAGALPSIVELGFALALGVLLDTLVVRPILLPAFLALLCRWRARAC